MQSIAILISKVAMLAVKSVCKVLILSEVLELELSTDKILEDKLFSTDEILEGKLFSKDEILASNCATVSRYSSMARWTNAKAPRPAMPKATPQKKNWHKES